VLVPTALLDIDLEVAAGNTSQAERALLLYGLGISIGVFGIGWNWEC
jgi:hypothetical protein